jgi:histidine triad (HIT) family protein
MYHDELVTAFHDTRPVTPVHILVVPNQHIASINDIGEQDEPILGHMILIARKLAKEAGVENSGYRLVFNTGPDAGQSVFHIHLHLIGGRHMPFRFE